MKSAMKFKHIECLDSSPDQEHGAATGHGTDSSSPTSSSATVDWRLYILCQHTKAEPVICPADRDGVGYKYVAETLQSFHDIDHYPSSILPISQLSGNGRLEATFREKKACWHKSCRSSSVRDRLL